MIGEFRTWVGRCPYLDAQGSCSHRLNNEGSHKVKFKCPYNNKSKCLVYKRSATLIKFDKENVGLNNKNVLVAFSELERPGSVGVGGFDL